LQKLCWRNQATAAALDKQGEKTLQAITGRAAKTPIFKTDF
jgi:hypothetical protein